MQNKSATVRFAAVVLALRVSGFVSVLLFGEDSRNVAGSFAIRNAQDALDAPWFPRRVTPSCLIISLPLLFASPSSPLLAASLVGTTSARERLFAFQEQVCILAFVSESMHPAACLENNVHKAGTPASVRNGGVSEQGKRAEGREDPVEQDVLYFLVG
jgi:hypothetical protein